MGTLYGPLPLLLGTPATQLGMLAAPGTVAVVVFNESPFFVNAMVSSSETLPLAAFTADIIKVGAGFSGSVTYNAVSYLTVSGPPPASVIFTQTLTATDSLARALYAGQSTGYPIALQRLSNIGNAISVGTSTTNLVNDGNALATQIVESTPTGAASSTISINNDGSVLLRGDIAGTLTTWLQFVVSTGAVSVGQTGKPHNVIGTALFPDGGIGFAAGRDILDFSGFDTFLKTRGAANVLHFQDNAGNDFMAVGSTGLSVVNGVNFTTGRIKEVKFFTGTGNSTVTHGMTGTPSIVVASSSYGSASSSTVNAGSFTSTQFSITTGVAAAPWCAVAFR